MKKAFNNPWVVGGLGLTALGAVYSNVMVPDMETLIRPPRAPVLGRTSGWPPSSWVRRIGSTTS